MSKRAEEYLHQFDQDGIPITNFTWDAMVECYDDSRKQAEKDLALTIHDLELLHTFLYAVKNNKHGAFTFTRLTDEQYAEVLKRYLEVNK